MEYVNLGNTDIKVSKVCLGCMGFGDPQAGMHSWTLPYEESKKIIKHALDQGINFFDTAMGYQGGTSEEYLGRAIKEFSKEKMLLLRLNLCHVAKYKLAKESVLENILKHV